MREDWCITEALLAGTRAMRKAKTRFMPRWPNEEEKAYEARLATATLFPAYRRTVGVMAGKPFSKALTLGDASKAVIDQWKPWVDDIDRAGVSLNVFASEMLAEAIGHGLCGIYVDVPKAADVPRTEAGVTTRAAETAAGLRPYFVRVRHEQILGWKLDDQGRLAMLRIGECAEVEDGDYGTRVVDRVRVLRPGSWELHERVGDAVGYQIIEQGTTNLSAIPFVPVYGQRVATMIGRPPLMDLAHLCVKHWQSQSDQDTILHVARVPILAVIGVDDEKWQLTVGASTAVKLPLQGDMKFIEHTGAAIKAGADSLAALEEQMIQTGAELLVQKPGQRTATEDANDAEGNKCDLQRITESFEDALDQALVFAGQYMGIDAPRVTLFKDFGAATLSDASAQIILSLQQGGLITRQTAIREQQRRGVLSADIDPEVEASEAANEMPSADPGALGAAA
jgi:hypothetical protein